MRCFSAAAASPCENNNNNYYYRNSCETGKMSAQNNCVDGNNALHCRHHFAFILCEQQLMSMPSSSSWLEYIFEWFVIETNYFFFHEIFRNGFCSVRKTKKEQKLKREPRQLGSMRQADEVIHILWHSFRISKAIGDWLFLSFIVVDDEGAWTVASVFQSSRGFHKFSAFSYI